MSKILIIQGSSRSDGETAKSVAELAMSGRADCVDLLKLDIGIYDYDYKNENDDFHALSMRMRAASAIVFATPVYWYAMSAPMKTMFDRLSDLVRVRKPDGRSLAGRQVYLVANGSDLDLPEGFEVPFIRTCDYFDMTYRGSHYLHTGTDSAARANSWAMLPAFADKIFASF